MKFCETASKIRSFLPQTEIEILFYQLRQLICKNLNSRGDSVKMTNFVVEKKNSSRFKKEFKHTFNTQLNEKEIK